MKAKIRRHALGLCYGATLLLLCSAGPYTLAAEPQDISRLLTLAQKADQLSSAGKFSEALPIAQQALEVAEKAFGSNDAQTASAVYTVGRVYKAMGEYAKAEPLFQRALIIDEKALGPEHSHVASQLNNLAELYVAMQEYAKAEPLYQRALKIREATLPPDDPDIGTILKNLAEFYRRKGNFAKARPLLERWVQILAKSRNPNPQQQVTALNDLAEVCKVAGDYAKAETLFQRALKICEEAGHPESPEAGMLLNNLAHLHLLKGDIAEAEEVFRRSLQMKEKIFGKDNPNVAVTLADFAQVYTSIADYEKAEGLYQRALQIAEKTLDPEHPHISTYLLNLGQTHYDRGEYSKADPLYQRALQLIEKTLGPDHTKTASALIKVANVNELLGDHGKAEPLYRRALQIREKTLAPESPDIASSLITLAGVSRTIGEAEALFQRALSIREKSLGPDHPVTARSLGQLAFLKIAKGDKESALKLTLRALAAEEKTLSNILSFTSEQQRLGFQRTSDPYSVLANLGSAAELAQVVLRRKAIVLDSLLEDRLVAEASGEPKQREAVEQLRIAKQRLTQLLLEVPKDLSEEAVKERAAEKDKLSRQVEELEASLARRVVGLGKARRALSVTVAQVQSALPRYSVLVELVRYDHDRGREKVAEQRYGAVLIPQSGPPKWVPLGSAAETGKLVTLYQKSARGETDQTTLSSVLGKLAEQVWTPMEKAFPPGTATVIISPEGDLSFVSFATLMLPDDKFVSEKYSIRYVASGRDLLKQLKTADEQKTTMRIFANPDFGAATSASRQTDAQPPLLRSMDLRSLQSISLPNLPGTEKESQELEALAKRISCKAHTTLGSGATEAELRKVNAPRVLHLATHGFFLPEPQSVPTSDPATQRVTEIPKGAFTNPMHRSGLAITGAAATLRAWAKGEAPPTKGDGVVTAEEVGGLKLDGTWLVVLSACETGSGEAKTGEGVMGLRRGFIQAGGQHLLMTLWPISDETTVRIMVDFYTAAFKSGNAPQALADTQRSWLVNLRKEKGLLNAVRLAGPFIMSSQGNQ